MPERREGNPIKKEVAKHLLRVKTKEISPLDSRICGLTRVSSEMLEYMLETGRLIQRDFDDAFNFSEPDAFSDLPNTFFVFPTSAILPRMTTVTVNNMIQESLTEPDELIRQQLIDMSHRVPQTHYFLAKLGKSFRTVDKELYNNAFCYVEAFDREAREELESRFGAESERMIMEQQIEEAAELWPYVPPEMVDKIYDFTQEAQERKGYLIGIDSKSKFNMIEHDNQYWPEVRLAFDPHGMPYQAIAAIEPLGPHEEAFFDNLKKS